MNTERDKFLTEAMGECWHDYVKVENSESWDEHSARDTCSFQCSKCPSYESAVQYDEYPRGNPRGWLFYDFNNFSTWEGFGKLFDWCKSQPWYKALEWRLSDTDAVGHIAVRFVNPDTFANTVYQFLKEQQQ